jgi:hypothetical protein
MSARRFAALLVCIAACLCATACAPPRPMRPAGTKLLCAQPKDIFLAGDASLRRMGYSPYHGNPGLVVGSRADATAAAPLTNIAAVALFPVGLAAGVALSPFDPKAPQLALAASPIQDAGYERRLIYLRAAEDGPCARVSITATHAEDAERLWADLETFLGPSCDPLP